MCDPFLIDWRSHGRFRGLERGGGGEETTAEERGGGGGRVRCEARRGKWGRRGDLLGRRTAAKARREGVLMTKFSNTEKQTI
jgi:hypothetical protein